MKWKRTQGPCAGREHPHYALHCTRCNLDQPSTAGEVKEVNDRITRCRWCHKGVLIGSTCYSATQLTATMRL